MIAYDLRSRYATQFYVPDGGRYGNDWVSRIDAVLTRLDLLEEALREIHAKPYRAEEVTARIFGESAGARSTASAPASDEVTPDETDPSVRDSLSYVAQLERVAKAAARYVQILGDPWCPPAVRQVAVDYLDDELKALAKEAEKGS